MTAVLLTPPYLQFFDANGLPLAGGKVYTYEAGGFSTPKATYTDSTKVTQLDNPITLDAAGRPLLSNGSIWIEGSYNFIVKDSLGNTIETTQNVTSFGTSSGGQIYNAATIATNNTGGFINKFRNGNVNVAQRGTSGNLTSTATTIVDGWYATGIYGASTSGGTWSLASGGGTFNNQIGNLSLTASGSGTGTITLTQNIESFDAVALSNNQCAFQVFFVNFTSSALTPTITTSYANSADNFSAVTQDLAATNLQTIGAGASGVLSYILPVSPNAYLGYQIKVTIGNIPAGTNFRIGNFDIRVTTGNATGLNSMPPVCEFPQMGLEVPRNKRYLDGFGETAGIVGIAYATSTTAFGVYIPFKNKMRAAPTGITVTTVGDLSIFNMANSSVAAVTALSFGNASEDGIFLTGTVASGLTADHSYHLKVVTPLAGNVIFTGAEL